ncbi:MAG: hypothetical protein AB7D57_05140 [Desulfovibrionaceae bacterium]
MKDERGLYYLPSLQTRDTRMYVREHAGVIEFRLYSGENPEIWDRHGWLALDVIQRAARMYQDLGRERNPMGLYDEAVARRLIADDAKG